jgi:hypothetical protein
MPTNHLYGCCLQAFGGQEAPVPIAPDTRDRLTSAVAQLVRIGRHVRGRAASQIHGTLRAGYVERHPDPRAGRANLLRITPEGDAALATARAIRSDWALSALAGWDEADAQLLGDLLDRPVADLTAAAPPRSAVPSP